MVQIECTYILVNVANAQRPAYFWNSSMTFTPCMLTSARYETCRTRKSSRMHRWSMQNGLHKHVNAAAGLSIMYLGQHFSYIGASSVGCLCLAVLCSFAWERGWPRYLSKGMFSSSKLCTPELGLIMQPYVDANNFPFQEELQQCSRR